MTTTVSSKAERGKQISVFVENESGSLSAVNACLAKCDVNIYALTLTGGLAHGYVRMVVDKHDEAITALRAEGYLLFERDVVLLELANQPGAMAQATQVWSDAGVNVEYAYCAGGPNVTRGLVVLKVDDVEKALKALS